MNPPRVTGVVLLVALMSVAARAQEPPPVAAVAAPMPFADWLAELRLEAEARGIRPEVLDAALAGIEPVAQILDRDRTQAEFTFDLDAYLARRLTRLTVRTAQQRYATHRALLQRVGKRYGVAPRVVVSIWGLESNFGRFAGVRPTIPALATLAYDPRRGPMFRAELLNALEILNTGDVDLARFKGSWAGAMGQPQFMPSSYLRYAQDFDKDGRRDIWTSLPDVFASIAYYIQQHGWTEGNAWGREVRATKALRARLLELPRRETGCRAVRLMTEPRPLTEWRSLGLRTMRGDAVPRSAMPASLLQAGDRTFLLYGNYEALLGYNCSHSYALSVALLADRLK